jgi:hypothetical protein
MFLSGVLMFVSDALRYYQSGPFQIKVALLVVAFVFHFTWFRKISRDGASFNRWVRRLTAVTAFLAWIGVGFAGRAIAFF